MRNILFAEDDFNLASIVVENLEEQGHQVKWVDTGENAVSFVQENSLDILFMDVELKGEMNGYEAVRQIRMYFPVLPVLFLTARQSARDLETAFQFKRADFIRKPYRMKEILLRMDTLLGPEAFSGRMQSIGRFMHDPVLRHLTTTNGDIRLPNLESLLLSALYEKSNQVVSKELLIKRLWGVIENPVGKEKSLHNLIYNLRCYFSADSAVQIEVISKSGYRLRV